MLPGLALFALIAVDPAAAEAPIEVSTDASIDVSADAPIEVSPEEAVAAPPEEAVAAPVEEAVAAPVEEAAATPIEEPIAAPVEETVATPIEEPVAAPAAAGATAGVSVTASVGGSAAGAAASTKPAKPPKPTPEERLAELDKRRVALNMGLRGYGRFLDAPAASGAGLQFGLGVRLVRGLYFQGEADIGAHALPVGAAARVFVGIRHELRMTKWVRPSYSLGYTHALELNLSDEFVAQGVCDCHDDHWGDFEIGVDAELAARRGAQAGLGLRFPFRKAPRLSLYLRADASYYFDDRPARLQVGGSLGFQLVF